ncbi:MAG: DUF1559 domain-containing protein [Planctomycetota bacterium]
MKFRLSTLLWLVTLLAASLAAMDGWGVLACGVVVLFWVCVLSKQRFTLVDFAVIALVAGVLIALLLPAVQTGRSSSSGWSTGRLLGHAIAHYHTQHGSFPPPFSVDAQGNRLHSWRALVLPSSLVDALPRGVRLDEPWHSETNTLAMAGSRARRVWQTARRRFMPAGPHFHPDETNFLAVVDSGAVFCPAGPVRRRDISDGPGNTIIAIQAFGHGIPWYEPRDLSIDEAVDLLCDDSGVIREWTDERWFTVEHYRGVRSAARAVCFADGRCEYLYPLTNRAAALALLTRAGGEASPQWPLVEKGHCLYPRVDSTRRVVRWTRVWGHAVFMLASLLPLYTLRP